jgi:hypothetical protein
LFKKQKKTKKVEAGAALAPWLFWAFLKIQ